MTTAAVPMFVTTQRRRRVATYGKASRKLTHDFVNGAAPFDDYVEGTRALLKERSTADYVIDVALAPQSDRSYTPPKTPAIETNNEFDVPSSDEDNALPKPSSATRRTVSAPVIGLATAKNDIAARVKFNTESKKRKRNGPDSIVENDLQAFGQHDQNLSKSLSQSRGLEIRSAIVSNEPSTKGKLQIKRYGVVTAELQVEKTSVQNGFSRKPEISSAPAPPRERLTKMRKSRHEGPSAPQGKLQQPRSGGIFEATAALNMPSTPPRSMSRSPPAAHFSPKSITTPRQKQLWKQLLDSDNGPADSGLHGLTAKRRSSSTRKAVPPSAPNFSLPSGPDTAPLRRPPKIKLIDRLVRERDSPSNSTDSEDEDSVPSIASKGVSLQDSGPREPDERIYKVLPQSQSANPTSGELARNRAVRPARSGPIMSYARQRSHLTEASNELAVLLHTPLDISVLPSRPSYQERRTRRPEPMNEPEDAEDTGGRMRNIHELRAAGGSTRFADDMNSLLDDFEDRALSARSKRRSAALEISSKLLDKHSVALFTDRGYDQRLLASVRDEVDPITQLGLTVSIALLAETDTTARTAHLVQRSGAIRMLAAQLDNTQDVIQLAKARSTNLSKVAQASVLQLRTAIQTAFRLSPLTIKVSPCAVALKVLELLLSGLREAGFNGGLLNAEATSKVAGLVRRTPLKPTLKDESPDVALLLELSLSVLELAHPMSGLLGEPSCNDLLIPMITDSFGILLQPQWSLEAGPPSHKDKSTSDRSVCSIRAVHLQTLALRFILNITNNDASMCDLIGHAAVTHAIIHLVIARLRDLNTNLPSDERVAAVDSLIVALGVMINLTEWSKAARCSIIKQDNEPLQHLLSIFLQGLNTASEVCSEEESHSNVAYGYLAVLLGNLCLNKQIRATVRAKLPGESLVVLVASIEEFIQYHQKVDQEMRSHEGNDGTEFWVAFTARLQSVVDRLKEADRRCQTR